MSAKVIALKRFAFTPRKIFGNSYVLPNRHGYLFTRLIANQKQIYKGS